jgi:hypothetical protein
MPMLVLLILIAAALGFACVVAGVFVLAGAGAALLVAGGLLFAAALILRTGLPYRG